MADVYVGSMWLTCGPETTWTKSEALLAMIEFDEFWTHQIERDWSTLVFEYTASNLADFKAFLNELLADQFTDTMRVDVGDAAAIFNDQFNSGWVVSAGGLHQGNVLASIKLGNGTDTYWSFPVIGSVRGKVYVHTSWSIYLVNT